jgi:hypothetical protein
LISVKRTSLQVDKMLSGCLQLDYGHGSAFRELMDY